MKHSNFCVFSIIEMHCAVCNESKELYSRILFMLLDYGLDLNVMNSQQVRICGQNCASLSGN